VYVFYYLQKMSHFGEFVFVVTGGGSGIGKALAHALAMRNKPVLIIGRREQSLIDAAAFSPFIQYFCADVSTREGRQLISKHLSGTQVITGLIHNAGIIEPMIPITTIDEAAWQQVMATNLDAPLFLSQLLYDKLINGRVLNISSGAAHFPVAAWTAYCVSKAALSMLTRCWQLESEHVAFASVMPGIIDTDMQAKIRNTSNMDTEKLDFFKRLQQERQLLSPATVASFLCWLLLDIDKAQYVSKEWDIYDQTHHDKWLVLPHRVPSWE
jgi:benzil reductase ((S)-benzoin forming)